MESAYGQVKIWGSTEEGGGRGRGNVPCKSYLRSVVRNDSLILNSWHYTLGV